MTDLSGWLLFSDHVFSPVAIAGAVACGFWIGRWSK